ncbi:MAG: SDR family oxidoreductase [Myxococcota bacterium]|nr:SDR family oxidoreductase [Myxococcota bacterium]
MSHAGCRFDYSGSRVLVTGGSNGIGAGIAANFHEAGADVVITGTRDSAADYDHDLSDYEYHSLQVKSPGEVEEVASRLGRLDVLVNNAGASLPGGRNEWEPDVFEESVAINLFGAFRMAIACKEMLKESSISGGGSVINLASMSSYIAVPMVPGYGAAKAGIVQMTLNLAVAWAGEGVRVNAVAPGLIESNMTAVMKGVEVLEKPQMARTPMGRWGLPSDVAPSILFLASEEAAFITGQTLNVDGGYSVA